MSKSSYRKTIAIITSAGTGSRFGKSAKNSKPKQFTNLLGKPVILYSLLAFQKCREVDEIIVSLNAKYFDYIHSLAAKYKITKLRGLVEGGKTRFRSVKNAFGIINAGKKDLVLIHDAARPNISSNLVGSLISESKRYGEVIIGTKVSETLKREKNGFISDTLNRENVWLIQTPQAFRYNILASAYKKCGRKNDFTDESALVEYAGYKVRITDGLKDNIKITTGTDLILLAKLMK